MNNLDKVLFITRAFHPPWNEGTRVIARDLVTIAQQARETEVISVTHNQYRQFIEKDAPITHIFTDSSYGFGSDYAALPKLVREVNAKLITSSFVIAHLIGIPYALTPWLKRKGIKTICHITLAEQAYNNRLEQLRHWLGWRLFDPWIDLYLLSSEALLPPLLKRGMPREKLQVLPPPLDTNIFHPREGIVDGTTNTFIISYIGSLSPLRFPARLVRQSLLQALAAIPRPIKLEIFAPKATHPYNELWSRQVSQILGEMTQVEITIQQKDLSDMEKAAVYQNASLVIIPFQGPVAIEPPLTLLEAMACGAVLAASPQANLSKIITHNQNGFIFSSPSMLADTINRISNQDVDLARMKQAARTTVVERFGFDKIRERLTKTWSDLDRNK